MRFLSFLLALILVLGCVPVLAEQDPYRPVSGYDVKQTGVEYAQVQEITYYSTTCEKERKFNLYLPVGYTEDKEYPVLYLLHGIGGDHREWTSGKPEVIVGNLVASGKAKEMIIVTPNIKAFHKDTVATGGYGPEMYAGFDNFINEITVDIMPYMAANYSVAEGRENTAIAGLSMGGRVALYVGLSLPETFGYVGAFAPAPGLLPYAAEGGLFTEETFKAADGYDTFILICTGSEDEAVGIWPETYSNALTNNGTEHIFYKTPGAHNFFVWKNGLYHFAQNLF
ncbi:MAG: esterase family protein [Clostridiales bacterium]|nr:esterase family protein [Clostridiales bacterium]